MLIKNKRKKILKEIYKKYAETEARFSMGYSYLMDEYSFIEAITEYEKKKVKKKVNVTPEITKGWISVLTKEPDDGETVFVYIPEMDKDGYRPIQFARYVKSIKRFFVEGTPTKWYINYWRPVFDKPV